MPNTRNYSSVDQRSVELQDIVERMPTSWTKWASLCMLVLLLLILLLGFVIKYPDTVDGELTLTSEQAPIRLVSSMSGRIHLHLPQGAQVQRGDVIGYFVSGTSYTSVRYLDSLLSYGLRDSLPSFALDIELGELSASYAAYVQAYATWHRLAHSTRSQLMRESLQHQITKDQQQARHLDKELELQHYSVTTAEELLRKDSILMRKYYLPEYEYRKTEHILQSQKSSFLELQSSRLAKATDIKQARLQLERSEVEERESIAEALSNLQMRYQILANEVRLWKERYLFIASHKGQLDYLGFWRENVFIPSGTAVFSIIPQNKLSIGEVIIPAYGAGKVKVGMRVNIKLHDYPYDEYGMLRGRVSSISRQTHTVTASTGTFEAYRVRLSLPEGTLTTFGRELKLNMEARGQAEIITQPRRLVERLFDKLKARVD